MPAEVCRRGNGRRLESCAAADSTRRSVVWLRSGVV